MLSNPTMRLHQIRNQSSCQTLIRNSFINPSFIHGLSLLPKRKNNKRSPITGIGLIKAVASTPNSTEYKPDLELSGVEEGVETIEVKAVLTVQPTITGFFKSLGIDRGFDDIQDLLGKSFLIELVSAELDPSKQ